MFVGGAVSDRRGFTLIELIVVLLLVAILFSIAVARYVDLMEESKISSLKASLDAVREGLRVFYVEQMVAGAGRYPTIVELGDGSGGSQVVATGLIPDNAFDADGTPANVVDASGQSRGTVIGAAGGWAYRPDTGEVWANTDTNDVHENTF